MREEGDFIQQEVSDPGSGGAGNDGVLAGLWFRLAAGAGRGWLFNKPGVVGGEVTPCRSHWVDSCRHELPQLLERVRGEEGRVFVVAGGGGVGGPLLEEHLLRAGSKSLIGYFHDIWLGNVHSGREGGMLDEWKPGEAFLQGQGKVCQGINREVRSQWWRGDFCPPPKREVDGGKAFHEMSRRVLGPEGGAGGDRRWESGWG